MSMFKNIFNNTSEDFSADLVGNRC